MKLIATILLALSTLKDVTGWRALRVRDTPKEGNGGKRQLEDIYYSQLYADIPYPITSCLIVKNSQARNDQELILGNCDIPNQAWFLDKDGLYHTELDNDFCMQAGRGGGNIQQGTKMRLFQCDKDNKRQQFVGPQSIGTIKLKDPEYDHLCLEFRGVKPNVKVDPIILKKCDNVIGGWSKD